MVAHYRARTALPKVGEIWRTRFNYRARIVADDVKGSHPILALVEIGANEIPATYTQLGAYRDPVASDFDLVSLMPADWLGEGWRTQIQGEWSHD